MSGLSADDIVTLTEVLMMVVGVAITWAVFYGSERAELPGTAAIPEAGTADDMTIDTRGRTLR